MKRLYSEITGIPAEVEAGGSVALQRLGTASGDVARTFVKATRELATGDQEASKKAAATGSKTRSLARLTMAQCMHPQRIAWTRDLPFAPIMCTTTVGTHTVTLINNGSLGATLGALGAGLDLCEAFAVDCNNPNNPFGIETFNTAAVANWNVKRMRWRKFWSEMYKYALVTHAKIKVHARTDALDGPSNKSTGADSVAGAIPGNNSKFSRDVYLKLHSGVTEINLAGDHHELSTNPTGTIWGASYRTSDGNPDLAGDGHYYIPWDNFRLEDKGGGRERMPLENQWKKKHLGGSDDPFNVIEGKTLTGSWSLLGHEGIDPAKYILDSLATGDHRDLTTNQTNVWEASSLTNAPKMSPKWYMWAQNGDATETTNQLTTEFVIELEQTVVYWGFQPDEGNEFKEYAGN